MLNKSVGTVRGLIDAYKALRAKLAALAKKLKVRFLVAEFAHNTDNAVMIAVAVYINYLKAKSKAPRSRNDLAGYPLVANGAMNIR